MAARDPVPSVVDREDFNAEVDAIALYCAMKGAGTDEDLIISIICARSYGQLKKVEKVYQQLYGRLLIDDLKGDLSGYFEKLSLALFMSNIEQDVVNLKEAVDGAGTDEDAIVEILCTRDNGEIELIKRLYKKRYGVKLVADMKGDTSGDFERIVVSMCTGMRDERGEELGEEQATAIAQIGSNEVVFNKVFCRRGFHQLREIFAAYTQFHEDGILDTISNEFSGCTEKAYKAIAITALEGREAFFAEKLHSAMQGLGTDEDRVLRLMVSRSRQDLLTVAERFQEKYEQSLEEFVDDDISGDFKAALLALVRGNNY
ncbi:annexin A7-like [Symsagittifera roscoffensis]|uniref:annexin A7-like n=1 Tax=Symsagittifera roscoffensis TaxID=84072 RepID=UPI00307B66E2